MAGERIEALYREVIEVADAARGYFDGPGIAARNALTAKEKTAVATESLAVTGRLMAVVSWFLRQQAEAAGDSRGVEEALRSRSELTQDVDAVPVPAALDTTGHSIALASRVLYKQVQALDRELNL